MLARFHGQRADAPKHARLRTAIVEAVEAGDLPTGTKMPGERELSQILGVSLGTTQKALGRLVDEGFLVRRQGHGTFVGSVRRPVSGSWHYRFRTAGSREDLPVFTTILDRRLVNDDGPWSTALGRDPKGYVLLRRRVDIGGKFVCASRLFLPATRFGRLMRMALTRLSDVNLKSVLALEFAAPTLTAEGLARVIKLRADDAKVMGLAANSCGLQVDIVARSFGRQAISFQCMLVPPTEYGLVIDFAPTDGATTRTGRGV
ncbi:MAG: GntR family transcriptional regulator [Burkholderiales bacterium]|nr:GntR family transcriptional regulator [Burkholderiales bacterium]